ncbi:MAG TPA: TonB family protein [Bordetella sp.]
MARRDDYLLIGLAISLMVHAGALAWRFAPRPAHPAAPALEVVLVNAHSDTAPARAQALAQQNLEGGGEARQGLARSPLPRTGESAETIVLQAMHKRQQELEQEQARLLMQLQSSRQAAAPCQPANPDETAADPGQDPEEQAGVIQNAQVAALSQRVQAYNKEPRRAYVGPATQASRYAAYLDGWTRRVEAIGTQHYPDDARGHTYGSLRITVRVKRDGSLAGFEIDQPSQYAVLNQAARRIVQMAAPFPPFPPDIARDTDELVITRTWHFVNDTLQASER